MKTAHLQSLLSRNAQIITFYHAENKVAKKLAREAKHAGYTDANEPARPSHLALAKANYNVADSYMRSINKLSEIQKALKSELRGKRPAVVH